MEPRVVRSWLSNCSDRASATSRLSDFALALGFDFVAFLEPEDNDKPRMTGEDPGSDIPVMWLIRPNRVQTWRVTKPIESWPIAATCVESHQPFIWRPGDSEYFSARHVAPRQRVAVHGFIRRFNVSAAITTPVHLDRHGLGFMTWFACGMESPPVDEWADLGPKLQQVATEFLSIIPDLPNANSPTSTSSLSAREIEVLRWSALGKSAEEIAEIIGRSAETVRFHLKNAVRKLGANNRVHAIALASYRRMLGDLSGFH